MRRGPQIIWIPRREGWYWFLSSRLQHVRWWQIGPVQFVWHSKPWETGNG